MAFSKPGDFHLEDFILNVPVIDVDFYKFCFLLSITKILILFWEIYCYDP
jgi:hypothetical protein